MNAVYTVTKNQKFRWTDRLDWLKDLASLKSDAGQAVPENCSAITEAILHEVSSREIKGTISLFTESLGE